MDQDASTDRLICSFFPQTKNILKKIIGKMGNKKLLIVYLRYKILLWIKNNIGKTCSAAKKGMK